MILKLPFFICRYPVFAKYSTNLSRALKKKKVSTGKKEKKSLSTILWVTTHGPEAISGRAPEQSQMDKWIKEMLTRYLSFSLTFRCLSVASVENHGA